MPDGNEISVAEEVLKEAPEILFKPEKVGLEYEGLPDLLINSIMLGCDVDLRRSLITNVILAGGCTALKGFADRFIKNMKVSEKTKVKLTAPKNRMTSCWIGGSTLASLKSFTSMWITKEEYKSDKESKVLFEKGFN